MKPDEPVQQYYLFIKELASRGGNDVESLSQYIIDGIPDLKAKWSCIKHGT